MNTKIKLNIIILSLYLEHYMKPGKIDVDAKLHQTSKMN